MQNSAKLKIKLRNKVKLWFSGQKRFDKRFPIKSVKNFHI